jgi:hypothetical protein
MKKQIGKVVFVYDKYGKLLKADFLPEIQTENTSTLLNRLEEISCETKVETIKANAEIVLSSWFTGVNEIELADRDKQKIVGEITASSKHNNGKIKSCTIGFALEDIKG